MAEENGVPGTLALRPGPDQGPAPDGVVYIFCRTNGDLALRNGSAPLVTIAGEGLHLKESHVMLAVSETEIPIP